MEIDSENPYRAIQGKLLSNWDVSNWQSSDFGNFMDFANHFYDPDKRKVSITLAKLNELQSRMDDPEFPFKEFMWRIDRFYSADDPDAVSVFRSFYPRFASMSRIVFAYLKKHPAILDSSLIEKIEGKPQYDWCMNLYRTKVTRIGAEIVEEDESGFEGNRLVKGSRDGISVPNAERLYMDSMIRAADLYNQLLKSIKPSEFRSMDIKDKISALAKLADVNKGMRNFKPNATVFNQLNVYGAQRDDLEKAILDFNKIG